MCRGRSAAAQLQLGRRISYICLYRYRYIHICCLVLVHGRPQVCVVAFVCVYMNPETRRVHVRRMRASRIFVYIYTGIYIYVACTRSIYSYIDYTMVYGGIVGALGIILLYWYYYLLSVVYIILGFMLLTVGAFYEKPQRPIPHRVTLVLVEVGPL